MNRGARMAALLAGCASALTLILTHEGWVTHTYPDPVHGDKVPTACAGVTHGVERGVTYSEDQCVQMVLVQAVQHASEIAPCLPDTLPSDTLGAFIDVTYTIGAPKFCKSSMARLARAGDLKGACEAIGLYKFSGGRDCTIRANNCRGLIERRSDEIAQCERGLS